MYFWTSIIKLVKKKMYKEAFVRLTSISVALQLVETSKDQAKKKPPSGCILTQIKTTSWPLAFYRPT